MNGLGDMSAGDDVQGRVARNAVLEQQRRLAVEFGSVKGDAPKSGWAGGQYERVLCEILTNTGWRGENARIFEALPHLTPILSTQMLRTVLKRLNVSLVPIERAPSELASEDLPSLVVDDEDRCWLLTAQGGDEPAIYDAQSRSYVRGTDQVPPRGTVHLVRVDAVEDTGGNRPFDGFVGHLLQHLRMPLLGICGYSAAIGAVGVALSLYVLVVYDNVIATKSLDTLAFLALGGMAALALELGLRRRRSKAIAYLAGRFDGVVSTRTLASVLSLPLSLTERAPLASQLSRFRQFEIGRELFAGNLASAVFDLPSTVLFVVLLFAIGGLLGFVPIGLSILIVLVCALAGPLSLARIAKVCANKLKSDTLLHELTDKLKTIRNASAEAIWLGRYAESLAGYQRSRFDSIQLGACLQSITNAMVAFAGILALGLGAMRVMADAMSLGELVAAMMIVWRILVPIQIVALNFPRLKQTLATTRQIDDLVRLSAERKSETPTILSRRLGGNIFASGVYLSLGANHEPQLRGANLNIKSGEIVALIGPSGSGKSTLLKVILGLYPQYIGTVRLDGLDLRQLQATEVRAAVGYVAQQPAFFHGSVAANFRFAWPEASDPDITDALAAVGVSLPHPALPDGLATKISGTEARSVSGGLLCRLAIARAVVKKPAILLLDDPGNGLDPAGDAALLAHLNTLRGKTTVILVTARPSHMRIADRVIEMHGGAVVGDGRPEIVLPRIIAETTAA
jgi:ABC-type bacteriocin/lantibiotic exporter with double-glycine peptidase domain